MYSFAEASHLAHVSSSTVRNWVLGYSGRDREIRPLFPYGADQGANVSFVQLIEIVIAAKFRTAERVSYATVQRAYQNLRESSKFEYPFAHERLEALGGHIVRMRDENPGASPQAVDAPEQWTFPGIVSDTMRQFDYESEIAARWFPVGKELPIVVDPRMSAGVPTVVGRGVTIETVHKRWKAGSKIEFIADDLVLEPALVETVLQYADRVAA